VGLFWGRTLHHTQHLFNSLIFFIKKHQFFVILVYTRYKLLSLANKCDTLYLVEQHNSLGGNALWVSLLDFGVSEIRKLNKILVLFFQHIFSMCFF